MNSSDESGRSFLTIPLMLLVEYQDTVGDVRLEVTITYPLPIRGKQLPRPLIKLSVLI